MEKTAERGPDWAGLPATATTEWLLSSDVMVPRRETAWLGSCVSRNRSL